MLKTIIAERFYRGTVKGRTQPSFFGCQSEDGESIDVVAKFTAGCNRPADLAHEVLGSFVAKSLGLPTPRTFIVEVPPALISAINDTNRQALIKKSCPLAFGSEMAPGYTQWEVGSNVPGSSLPLAAAIWVFDAACENADRGKENVNLLAASDDWLLIDHELAWPGVPMIGAPKSWQTGGLKHLVDETRHIFTKSLKEGALDLTMAQNGWQGLSLSEVSLYAQTIPSAWNATTAVSKVLSQLDAVQTNLAGLLAETRRVLT
ncbi:MAG: HipA family kinase [Janthinobacterium lividum]